MSGFFLASALYVYPMGALAFFWPQISRFFLNGRFTFKEVYRSLLFFAAVGALAMTVHILLIKPLMCNGRYFYCTSWKESVQSDYQLGRAYDVMEKLSSLVDVAQIWGGSWMRLLLGWKVAGVVVALAVVYLGARASVLRCVILVGIIILLNGPNLVTPVFILGYRTTSINTILIALGVSYLLGLEWGGQKAKRLILLSLVTLLMTSSFLASQSFSVRQSKAWEDLKSAPGLVALCKRGAPFQEFVSLISMDSMREWITLPLDDLDHLQLDLGLAPVVGWTLRGICHLEAKPGTEFTGSLPYK
jgi:hypothetical protein